MLKLLDRKADVLDVAKLLISYSFKVIWYSVIVIVIAL